MGTQDTPHLNRSREEQAERELGETRISRGGAWLVVVLFVLTVLAVGAAQTTSDLAAHFLLEPDDAQYRAQPYPQVLDVFAQSPTLAHLNAFEDELEERSVVANWFLPRVQAVLAKLGSGNEQVVIGRDPGWLFYTPGVSYVTGRGFLEDAVLLARSRAGDASQAAVQPDPVAAIVHFRDQLQAVDPAIRLVVMPTPVKPQVHPEKLGVGAAGVANNASYAAFVEQLRASGVDVFDPLPALAALKDGQAGESVYLRADTHWTFAAMRHVAGLLAVELRDGLLAADETVRVVHHVREIEVANRGDIHDMLKLPEGMTVSPVQRQRIVQILAPEAAGNGSGASSSSSPAAADRELVVTGTVKEIARPPRPFSQPYADCLIGMLLTDVKAAPGSSDGVAVDEDVLVYAWGMRENKWVWSTKVNVGDAVTLRLERWEAVDPALRRLELRDVEDEAAFVLEPWFGEPAAASGDSAREVGESEAEGDSADSWRPTPGSRVLLLGDSFSDIYSGGHLKWGRSAGLGEQLSAALGEPIDVLIVDGNGSWATREALAREMARGRRSLAGVKVVIWQFATRELTVGDWKFIELPAGQ